MGLCLEVFPEADLLLHLSWILGFRWPRREIEKAVLRGAFSFGRAPIFQKNQAEGAFFLGLFRRRHRGWATGCPQEPSGIDWRKQDGYRAAAEELTLEEAKMNCLIIVDVQNDFCPGGALPVPEGDQVVPVINRLVRRFDRVVATQDWHPPDHLSFAVNHPGKKPGDVIRLGDSEQVLWPVHCVQNTPGAEFHPDLDRSAIQQVFRKGMDREIDSYSGFFDNRRRRATGLEEYLRREGVDEVYICGLATDYCVRWTALDAQRLGFRTWVIVDACRGVERHPGDVATALEQMSQAGCQLIWSSQLLH